MGAGAMARERKATLVVPDPNEADAPGDALTEEDIEQAQIGDLFSIQGSEFDNVSWSIFRFRTRPEIAADPQGQPEEWVADRTGQLHGTDLSESIGGGTFRFRGYRARADGNGVSLAYNRTIALAGPRKNFAAPPPTPVVVAPTANGLSRGERIMLRMLRNQEQRLQLIERAAVSPVVGPSLKDMAETMVLLQSMSQRGQPASDTSIAKELFGTMMAATKTGIELGQGREPLPPEEVNTTVKVLEAVAPLASRFLDILATRRTAPPPRRPAEATAASPPETPAAAAPSSAEVVVETPETVQPIIAARMMVVVDTLAMGATNQDEVEEIADLIAGVLPAGELEAILRLPDLVVLDDIAQKSSGQYPILATEAGRNYVAAVLSELRRVPEPDDDRP
jgi:hypothetical protein